MDKPKHITKICKKHGDTSFVLEGRGAYRCRACRSEAVIKRRITSKVELINAFGGACQCCGYNRFSGALEFHHVDETQKDFAIGESGRTRSFERNFAEAKKCVLVCSVCHKEIHAGVRECPPLLYC